MLSRLNHLPATVQPLTGPWMYPVSRLMYRQIGMELHRSSAAVLMTATRGLTSSPAILEARRPRRRLSDSKLTPIGGDAPVCGIDMGTWSRMVRCSRVEFRSELPSEWNRPISTVVIDPYQKWLMTPRIIRAVPWARKWKVHLLLLGLVWLLSGSHLPVAFGVECPRTACKSRVENARVRNPASQFAFADFDGDRHPDLATAETIRVSSLRTRYWISFQLSRGRLQTIDVTAPSGGLALVVRDVNGDSALDLVLVTAWRHKPVAVLLNDGAGNFAVADAAKLAINVFPSTTQLGIGPRRFEDRAILPGQSPFRQLLIASRRAPATQGLRLSFSGSLDVAATSFLSSFSCRAPPLSVLDS